MSWCQGVNNQYVMVSHSKTTANSNKTKWISTLLQPFKTKFNKRLKRIDTSTRG